MEEAELTLASAQAVFDRAKEKDEDLWANVVKSCYDAMEDVICSAIASKEEKIPIRHPEKINKFNQLFEVSSGLNEKIFFWMGKRSSAHYVDIKDNKLSVPHELFSEEDAKKALDDSREVVDEIKEKIKRGKENNKENEDEKLEMKNN